MISSTDLNCVALEIDLFAIHARSSLATSVVEGGESLASLSLEKECRGIAAELTENTSSNA